MPVTAPSTPTHRGIIAATTAAPPDDAACDFSARATNPLPPTNSKMPIGAARSQSASFGQAAPRPTATSSITRPAAAKRMLPMRNGGSSRSAIAIARYVEPQMR